MDPITLAGQLVGALLPLLARGTGDDTSSSPPELVKALTEVFDRGDDRQSLNRLMDRPYDRSAVREVQGVLETKLREHPEYAAELENYVASDHGPSSGADTSSRRSERSAGEAALVATGSPKPLATAQLLHPEHLRKLKKLSITSLQEFIITADRDTRSLAEFLAISEEELRRIRSDAFESLDAAQQAELREDIPDFFTGAFRP